MEKTMFLTEDELKIVDLFLIQGKSIREISETLQNYGRTKINNILKKYASISEENANKIELRKLGSKYHKEINSKDEINLDELTEKQIQKAYKEIVTSKKSLTQVATELGKQRDTLKRAIIKYLEKDRVRLQAFKEAIQENINLTPVQYKKKFSRINFDELTEEEKKEEIFRKLNLQRKVRGQRACSNEFLETRYDSLINFFKERNIKIKHTENQISKNQLLKMMFDFPSILNISLFNKIESVIDMLDNKYLDVSKTSYILQRCPEMLSASLVRTALQIRILKDANTIDYFLENPKSLRVSPELMYAMIKIWNDNGRVGTPFISIKRLNELCGKTQKEICEEYNVRDKYGDDEYFDRS